VPNLVGATQDEAANVLAGLGLVPAPISAVSPTGAEGTVVGQQPAADSQVAPGGQVVLQISRGYPSVIFDQNGNIVEANGQTGTPVKQLAASQDIEEEVSASFATPFIAFRRGPSASLGQIFKMNPADPISAQAVTDDGSNDGRPAISPDGKVVAFISNRNAPVGDTDLCFASMDQTNQQGQCIADRDTVVSRPAWSPDGRSIVVVATTDHGPGLHPTELQLYTSAVPNSGNPGDWTSQGFVTQTLHKERKTPVQQVLMGAFSPDGKTLAVTANWTNNTFIVWTVPVVNGVLTPPAQPQPFIAGCELSWRPDGLELAVTQRDRTCDAAGRIVRVALANPNVQTVITPLDVNSGTPVWSPPAAG
jgi:Tol biopolymer transport system component